MFFQLNLDMRKGVRRRLKPKPNDMAYVLRAYNRTVAFEGTEAECTKFILDQCFTLDNGRKIYRTWTDENGDHYYDADVYVFIYNGKFGK